MVNVRERTLSSKKSAAMFPLVSGNTGDVVASALEFEAIAAASGQDMQVRQGAPHGLASAALYLGVPRGVHEVRRLDRQAAAIAADDLEARRLCDILLRCVHCAEALSAFDNRRRILRFGSRRYSESKHRIREI
jgi:hypothetical protein